MLLGYMGKDVKDEQALSATVIIAGNATDAHARTVAIHSHRYEGILWYAILIIALGPIMPILSIQGYNL